MYYYNQITGLVWRLPVAYKPKTQRTQQKRIKNYKNYSKNYKQKRIVRSYVCAVVSTLSSFLTSECNTKNYTWRTSVDEFNLNMKNKTWGLIIINDH